MASKIDSGFAGRPAVDTLGSLDLKGNPSFVGAVVNGGPSGGALW